jgi:D-alanine-D-alanine ligase
VLHGGWGEDGRAQAEMEALRRRLRRLLFRRQPCSAWTRSRPSRPCAPPAIPAIPEVAFAGAAKPTAAALVAALGEHLVIKPSDQGSSVGLYMLEGEGRHGQGPGRIPAAGQWMAERRLRGARCRSACWTSAMGVVEIVPLTGVYDYKTEYTKGASEHLFPAPIPAELTAAIGEAAARLFGRLRLPGLRPGRCLP